MPSPPTLSSQGKQLVDNPVIEHAVLRLAPSNLSAGLSFIHKAAHLCSLAASSNQSSTTFRVLHSTDASDEYLLTGVWPSLQAHHAWIDSAKNQELLAEAKEAGVGIGDFFHWSSPGGSMALPTWFDDASFLAVEMQYPLDVPAFLSARASAQKTLSTIMQGREAGGWRIEAAIRPSTGLTDVNEGQEEGGGVQEGDEWVRISGLDNAEEHLASKGVGSEDGETVRQPLFATRHTRWKRI